MAFFPAEVLVQLYELLGDVRVVMSALAVATELLLVAAILAGILILMRLYRQRFAVLRALGASRAYIFAVVWTFSFALIAAGSLLGLAIGAGTDGHRVGHLRARRAASRSRRGSAGRSSTLGGRHRGARRPVGAGPGRPALSAAGRRCAAQRMIHQQRRWPAHVTIRDLTAESLLIRFVVSRERRSRKMKPPARVGPIS